MQLLFPNGRLSIAWKSCTIHSATIFDSFWLANMKSSGKYPHDLEKDLAESFRVNVIGNINLFNLFLPLIRKGDAKKVITISSGMADIDLISKYDIDVAGPYAISKAAMNAAVAKYSAVGRKEGILFMSISPGLVETGHHSEGTEHSDALHYLDILS